MAKADEEKTVKKKVKLDRDMMVSLMNVHMGPVTYVSSRTGAEWRWDGYGEIQDMELGELQTLMSGRPRFIKEPWLVILDEEVVEYLNLTKPYDALIKPDELDRLFTLTEKKLSDRLSKAPNGSKALVIARAKQMIEEGSLTVGKQRVVEEVCGTKLIEE